MNARSMQPGLFSRLPRLLAGLAIMSLPAAASGQMNLESRQPLATVTVSNSSVYFSPSARYSSAVLTVSGGEVEERRVFEPGEPLEISIFDREGELLPDGSYTWELELLPDEATAKELRLEATYNGGEALSPRPRESGYFAIVGGGFASPDLGEAGNPLQGSGGSGLEGSRPFSATSTNFIRATAPIDDDAAVGSREGVEAEARTAASAAAPPFEGIGSTNFERSDLAAAGTSPSHGLPEAKDSVKKPSAAAQATRRSTSNDGANGRPRADEDQ